MQGVVHFFQELRIARCTSCEARDMHIASLKEELRGRDALIESLRDGLNSDRINQQLIIEHVTGMNRAVGNNNPAELHSIHPRSGIQSRIRRAEQADAEEAGALIAKRKRAYDERIESLNKPELELVEEVTGHAV